MSDDGWGDEPVKAAPPTMNRTINAQSNSFNQSAGFGSTSSAPSGGFGSMSAALPPAPISAPSKGVTASAPHGVSAPATVGFGHPGGDFNTSNASFNALSKGFNIPTASSGTPAPANSGGFGAPLDQGDGFGAQSGGFGSSITSSNGGSGGFGQKMDPPVIANNNNVGFGQSGFGAASKPTPATTSPAATSSFGTPVTTSGFGAPIAAQTGSFSSSGFGSAAATQPAATSGGFGKPATTSAFGQPPSGFGGASAGFGSASGGGFGSSSGGGSFGTSGGNRFEGGGTGGGFNCFNCNQAGHKSMDCPEPKKPRGGGGGTCFNCDQPGHRAGDCPEPRKPRGGRDGGQSFGSAALSGDAPASFGGAATGFGGATSGFGGAASGFASFNGGNQTSGGFNDNDGGGDRSRACFNCKEEGHRSSECPHPEKPSSCFNCGEEGHMSSDCTQPPKVTKCYNCAEEGHRSSDCTQPPKPTKCYNCKEEGHRTAECPKPPKPCFNCKKEGHRTNDCPEPKIPARCFNCFADGHYSSECTEPKRIPKCNNCDQEGHRSTECTEPLKPREDGAKPASTFVPMEESPEELYHAGVEKGNMFDRFFDAKVTTTRAGLQEEESHLPILQSFAEFNIDQKICQNIVQSDYSKPTPVQQHTMPIINSGKDVLACAQTGSGKTAAYLLPIMSRLIADGDLATIEEGGCKPRCIIISPTRELTVQIYNESRKFSNGTALISKATYGGTHVGFQKNSLLTGGASIVVGTIGRLNQFVSEGVISLEKIRFLVLDEADRMMEIGLQEDIRQLIDNSTMPDKTKRQTIMFSATFPVEVQVEARHMLKDDYVMVAVDEIGTANKCITQEVIMIEQQEKKDKLLEMLDIDIKKYEVDKESNIFKKKTLIFVSKKTFADVLGAIVSTAGVPATTIHGDRLQNERAEAIRDFVVGRKAVLIATAVAERGLDIRGVDHVINYDLPDKIDEYVHRIGRTGRVGNSGRATSFYIASKDFGLAPGLVKCMESADQVVPEWLLAQAEGAPPASSGFEGMQTGAAKAEEEW